MELLNSHLARFSCLFWAENLPVHATLKEEKKMGEQKSVEDLDLRSMPVFKRHDKIFQTWDTLQPGQTLRIINDHDPKPLWYQFEVEYKGKYEWEYEQKGPEDWIVKIKRI